MCVGCICITADRLPGKRGLYELLEMYNSSWKLLFFGAGGNFNSFGKRSWFFRTCGEIVHKCPHFDPSKVRALHCSWALPQSKVSIWWESVCLSLTLIGILDSIISECNRVNAANWMHSSWLDSSRLDLSECTQVNTLKWIHSSECTKVNALK